jgi:hypothetical protein
MDLGDWQELSRVRVENHVWHRCTDDILEAVRAPGATHATIAASVEQCVDRLNKRLVALHRRPVLMRSQRS